MAICSRNYSLCCTVLSGWGIIQLVVMGLLFYYQAIAFAEDLNIEIKEKEANQTISDFWAEANEKYENTASNCWVAAGIYVITFLISLQQFYASKN